LLDVCRVVSEAYNEMIVFMLIFVRLYKTLLARNHVFRLVVAVITVMEPWRLLDLKPSCARHKSKLRQTRQNWIAPTQNLLFFKRSFVRPGMPHND
jgi:hypothetical protein